MVRHTAQLIQLEHSHSQINIFRVLVQTTASCRDKAPHEWIKTLRIGTLLALLILAAMHWTHTHKKLVACTGSTHAKGHWLKPQTLNLILRLRVQLNPLPSEGSPLLSSCSSSLIGATALPVIYADKCSETSLMGRYTCPSTTLVNCRHSSKAAVPFLHFMICHS